MPECCLPIPGFEHAITHSDAWNLKHLPASMAVIGSGATGAQVASIFNAFGTKVSLFEVAPRILMTEDEAVSVAIKEAFEAYGIQVVEGFAGIEEIEKTAVGVRFRYQLDGESHTLDVSALVMAVGWLANAEGLNLKAAGMKAGLTVSQLADLPLSFPTYVEIVGWAAYDIVQQLGLDGGDPH